MSNYNFKDENIRYQVLNKIDEIRDQEKWPSILRGGEFDQPKSSK